MQVSITSPSNWMSSSLDIFLSMPGRRAQLRITGAAAQTRMVSVARIRLVSRKSTRLFKGIICDDISEFESHMPSQAVESLCGTFGRRIAITIRARQIAERACHRLFRSRDQADHKPVRLGVRHTLSLCGKSSANCAMVLLVLPPPDHL